MEPTVAPLALPTDMGTTRAIEPMENTQFRARNGKAQAYVVTLSSDEERAEWIKHSVMFLERHSTEHAQIFFDPLSPQYFAKTWSALNHVLAHASFETYPTASHVQRRWRYMGVVDNVNPYQGFNSHKSTDSQALVNVVIGQWVRAFNYWQSCVDGDELTAHQTGLFCWGVIRKEFVGPSKHVSTPSAHTSTHLPRVSATPSLRSASVSGTATPMDMAELHSDLEEEQLRDLVLPFGPDTPLQGYARVQSIRPDADPSAQYPYAVFDKPMVRQAQGHDLVDSGHQTIDVHTGSVHTNRYAVLVEPKLGQHQVVSQLDLYPVTHAMRDIFMAVRHGMDPEAVPAEDPVAYLNRHYADATVPCDECAVATHDKLVRATLSQARSAADQVLVLLYMGEMLAFLDQEPGPGDFWLLFPGFALALSRDADGDWVSTIVVNAARGEVSTAEYNEAQLWAAFVIDRTPWLHGQLPYNYKGKALVLPAVLWPFWPNNNPLVASDDAIAQTYSNWRQEVRALGQRNPYYKVAAVDLDHVSEFTEDSRSELSVEDRASIQQQIYEIKQQLKQQPLVRTDWYERGERWQIMPVVTTTPDPPCESTPDTEPIFMGRCGFIMGSREKQFGICTRFVQPEDPRAALVELASQMQQLDLVVAHR